MSRVSIITINYNNAAGLKKTIDSVVNQKDKTFEYIVIDGGSTDGSVELINQNKGSITYWESEKDKGIYHAMNKGWQKASGEYCLFLNSGDYLESEHVIESILPQLNGYDLIYGDMMMLSRNGAKMTKSISPDKYLLTDLVCMSLPHPATFTRRKLLEELGGFDESFRIVSDWLFFVQSVIEKKSKMKHVDIVVSVFDTSGISNTSVNHKEHIEAIRKKYPHLEDVFESLSELRRYKLSRAHRVVEWIISRTKRFTNRSRV